jgi:hypothetical protein
MPSRKYADVQIAPTAGQSAAKGGLALEQLHPLLGFWNV